MVSIMERKGDHTYSISLSYEICPECKKIFESRQKANYQSGHYVKPLKCPYCQKEYTKIIEGRGRKPFFGEPSKPEMEW